ncbi:MAG: PEP-CTERM sorting domain-containing protein [Leptolyngbyaceae cyanobacterium]
MLLRSTSLIPLSLSALAIAATAMIAETPSATAASLSTEAFADNVISYQRGTGGWGRYFGEANATDDRWQVYDPDAALGHNNWTAEMTNRGSLGQWDQSIGTSLGNGGSLIVEFTDNRLTGSGTEAADLWIFEIGGVAEEMSVAISMDNEIWYDVGIADRPDARFDSGVGIDIDGLLNSQGLDSGSLFSFVRVTDTGNNKYGNFKAGADIDAIAALSSIPSSGELSEAVPEPGLIFALGAVGVGTLLRRKSA